MTSSLTSDLQITIFCKNQYVEGLHVDQIDVYASYRNQQITPLTTIPPTYLDSHDVTIWSPYLNKTTVPIDPYLAETLAQDLAAGTVVINVKATLRLRYKDAFIMVRYGVEVNCPGYVSFVNETDGNVIGSLVKDTFIEGCHTHTQ
ncbi:hypothetical protein QVD17_13221 [Tagetes erecta]|nr:hypothetical protein QVD17_13221 [Tagetes erecta]